MRAGRAPRAGRGSSAAPDEAASSGAAAATPGSSAAATTGDANRRRDAGHGARLLRAWNRLSGKPGGRWLFSRLVGRMAPYTGSMGARVEVLDRGRAEVTLRDRRRVRNHLRSVHAIALANLGELTTGLAMTSAMPAGVRGIPVAIRIDYLKKARGTLTCASEVEVPAIREPTSHAVQGDIRDAAGDVVATIHVTWQLEPVA
jgi:acyl-coenzyme A thioesterase PaaI-like protein